jgi:hypothetical protein
VLQKLERIQAAITELLRQRTVKDFYEIEEFAALVGKAPFTSREWARLGRIHAAKKNNGRGAPPPPCGSVTLIRKFRGCPSQFRPRTGRTLR